VELPLKSKGENPKGKSALRQVVSMVIQLERAGDVATEGCRCNGGNPKRGPLRYIPSSSSGDVLGHGSLARFSRHHAPIRHLRVSTLPLLAANTPRCSCVYISMMSGDTPFRLWSEVRTMAGDRWDVKRFEAIVRPDGREAAWLGRRRHAPRGRRLPAEWGMDPLYLRLP
jgi:hypothetical protein